MSTKKSRSSSRWVWLSVAAVGGLAALGMARSGDAKSTMPALSTSGRVDLKLPALDREISRLAAEARTAPKP